MGRRLTKWSGGDRCHSGGFLLRIMPPSWQPVPACASNGHSAGRLLFPATTTKQQAGHYFLRQRQSSRLAVLHCDNDKAAGRPFNTATTGFRRRNYSSLRQRKLESDASPLRQILLQAGHSSLRRRKFESDTASLRLRLLQASRSSLRQRKLESDTASLRLGLLQADHSTCRNDGTAVILDFRGSI